MKVLITGASGFIGSRLASHLHGQGHEIFSLSRAQPSETSLHWDPDNKIIEANRLEGFDAIIHLAGAGVAEHRWSSKVKSTIWKSRVEGTRFLVDTLSGLKTKPRVFIASSATGYYGSRPGETLTEESSPGRGFLAELASAWEKESAKAVSFGLRVVMIRTGLVLARNGGALGKMRLPFKLGLGGPVGDGSQIWSWIEMHDLVRAVEHLLNNSSSQGPYNLVAPRSVTNLEFTRSLGSVLGRPTFLPTPAFALRLALGEMADELLLASARVEPKKLLAEGFQFETPELMQALRKTMA